MCGVRKEGAHSLPQKGKKPLPKKKKKTANTLLRSEKGLSMKMDPGDGEKKNLSQQPQRGGGFNLRGYTARMKGGGEVRCGMLKEKPRSCLRGGVGLDFMRTKMRDTHRRKKNRSAVPISL